jgi:hypothetical protein
VVDTGRRGQSDSKFEEHRDGQESMQRRIKEAFALMI